MRDALWRMHSGLAPLAGGGARDPQPLPEPAGSGVHCSDRGAEPRTQAVALGFSLPLVLSQGGCGALSSAICDWIIAQVPDGGADLDQLMCDGKTLRASIEPTPGGGSPSIALLSCLGGRNRPGLLQHQR